MLRRLRARCADTWPIDQGAAKPPAGWPGWPDGKKFALVLTHDADTRRGHERCLDLMELEMSLGFRSVFNLVPRRYDVSPDLRKTLLGNGFEVGVHGLYHDGKYFESREIFSERARQINEYIREWNAVGFRAPSMLHNLDWIHELDIEYDASTFDTDPFEPQPDGMNTIFPFWVPAQDGRKGYVELPYTLPQDFLMFVLLQQTGIGIWKEKLELDRRDRRDGPSDHSPRLHGLRWPKTRRRRIPGRLLPQFPGTRENDLRRISAGTPCRGTWPATSPPGRLHSDWDFGTA